MDLDWIYGKGVERHRCRTCAFPMPVGRKPLDYVHKSKKCVQESDECVACYYDRLAIFLNTEKSKLDPSVPRVCH